MRVFQIVRNADAVVRDHRGMPTRRLVQTLLTAAGLAAAAFGALALDVGGRGPAEASAAGSLPAIGDVRGYTRWLKLRTAYAGGSSAHGGTKTVYISDAAAARRSRGKRGIVYPRGTFIVKTATRTTADGDRFLALVAIMEKVRATDRELGKRATDWRWAEYTRSAPGDPLRLVAGGDQGLCTACHQQAMRTDFSFTRLR